MVFKCKMCGGALNVKSEDKIAVCEYCGSTQTLPKLDDDKKLNLYERANHYRRNNEFDKAEAIFEQVLNEDVTDAEAYWSLVLCKYGVEYVEDPATHKRVPTIHRMQYTSVFDDENYKLALKHAEQYQREVYEAEAKALNEIQKGVLAISQKEKPFDVFICYKESDENNERTRDSVLAQEIYDELTGEGLKVFFSRITLEDKLGTAYEPYIFAALNSAKVMVVVGTKAEHFNAVWVKNEWSRYLSLIKNGAKKVLIPAYRDMDAYDLPEEFAHLQAQDMAKIGFIQDLVRGIKKITGVNKNSAGGNSATLQSMLKRAFLTLEDGDFGKAQELFDDMLNIDPENAQVYIVGLLCDCKADKLDDLRSYEQDLTENSNYEKALRFADAETKQKLEEVERENRAYRIYNMTLSMMSNIHMDEVYQMVKKALISLSENNYKDSKQLLAELPQKREEIIALHQKELELEREKEERRLAREKAKQTRLNKKNEELSDVAEKKEEEEIEKRRNELISKYDVIVAGLKSKSKTVREESLAELKEMAMYYPLAEKKVKMQKIKKVLSIVGTVVLGIALFVAMIFGIV